MKVRAYLAKGEDRLVASQDSSRQIDVDTATDNPDQIKQLCRLLPDVEYLGYFESLKIFKEYLDDGNTIYRKTHWKGPGYYLLWQRMIYRSDILLGREIRFTIALEEHIVRNSEGELDRNLMERK